jgi:heme O synthase-like polyprenyltransferase
MLSTDRLRQAPVSPRSFPTVRQRIVTTLDSPTHVGQDGTSWRRTLAAYVALTKPRIIELLLVTTVPTMFLAQRGVPSWWLVVATLIGGTLSAGSANTFNMVYDRDIDAHMGRTSKRPLVTGEVTPRAALIFATVLALVSTLWFALVVNVLSAVLSLAAIALYAVGYTMILKRRTSQNIVWGGAAGCMPVLIGWSAVTNSVSWAAVDALPGDLLLDAAALLAAVDAVQGRLRASRVGADAARGRDQCRRRRASDRRLFLGDGG